MDPVLGYVVEGWTPPNPTKIDKVLDSKAVNTLARIVKYPTRPRLSRLTTSFSSSISSEGIPLGDIILALFCLLSYFSSQIYFLVTLATGGYAI